MSYSVYNGQREISRVYIDWMLVCQDFCLYVRSILRGAAAGSAVCHNKAKETVRAIIDRLHCTEAAWCLVI